MRKQFTARSTERNPRQFGALAPKSASARHVSEKAENAEEKGPPPFARLRFGMYPCSL
jgi:hypothetical protein